MTLSEIQKRAIEIREKYEQYEKTLYGKEWATEDLAMGFVGDVGDLMKLIQAQNGTRQIDDSETKLAHEFSDCLWSILVLASKYNINLEESFLDNMVRLEKYINDKMSK